ncbi:MAG: winged helix-turn-helix transcriptional regulator [Candidatus Hodarchaeota archaeon]
MLKKRGSLKKKLVILYMFGMLSSSLLFISLIQETSAWNVMDEEILPGVPEDISDPIGNSITFHVNSNVTAYLSVTVDNSLKNQEIYINISSTSPVNIVITAEKEFNNKKLQVGSELEIVGSQSRFKYSFGFAFKFQVNTSNSNFTLGANVNSYGNAQNKLSWIKTDVSESTTSPWELMSSDLIDDNLYTTTTSSGFYTIAEEYTPTNWAFIITAIAIPALIAVSILLISKHEYLRNVSLKVKGVNVPVHRMSFERVVKNKIRSKILDLVLGQPGIHLNELMRKLELDSGAMNWHLQVLEDYKLIKRKKVGQYITFFPRIALEKDLPLMGEATMIMKNQKALKILYLLDEEGPKFQAELASILGVDKKTIRYHGKILEKIGTIEFKQVEGKKFHQITNKGKELLNTIEVLLEPSNGEE